MSPGDPVLEGIGLFKVLLNWAIPERLRKDAMARLGDINPFKVIPGNHDLIRAVRLAWIDAALDIISAVEECASNDHPEKKSILTFCGVAHGALVKARTTAFDRRNDPQPMPIDAHAQTVIDGVSEFVSPHAAAPKKGALSETFAQTLAELTGYDVSRVPNLFDRIADDGLPTVGGGPKRSFDELVFAAFAELLKSPKPYPEAKEAFHIHIGRETLEALRAALGRLADLDRKIDELAKAPDLESQFQTAVQERLSRMPALLEGQARIEALAGLLPGIDRKVDTLDSKLDALHDKLDRFERIATQSARPPNAWRWPTPWDFSRFLDERRRGYTGRKWLFAEVAQWLATGREAVLLVQADYGVGKSAFVAELVHTNPGGAVIAHYCCQHDTRATLNPETFVSGLAAQLAKALPEYARLIEADDSLQKWLTSAHEDAGSALEQAVLAPLAKIAPPQGTRLIVIDALDEALEFDGGQAPGRQQTKHIVELLAARTQRLPAWLRVLATTRKRAEVVKVVTQGVATKAIDAEDARNIDDLRGFIRARAGAPKLSGLLQQAGMAVESLIETFTQKAGGKFLYALRALDDVERGQLKVTDIPNLPPGMDGFYADAFARRFARTDYVLTRAVLGVLAAAQEPMARADVAAVLEKSERDVQAALAGVSDFLRVADGRWRFDHVSLPEWLSGEDTEGNPRAGGFAVDLGAAKQRFHAWARKALDVGVAHDSGYLLRHLAAHLPAQERIEAYSRLLLDFRWLQQKLAVTGFQPLLGDFQHVQGATEAAALESLERVLRQAGHVLDRADGTTHLPTQLLARGLHLQELRPLCASVPKLAPPPWLRPLSASLSASGALLATLPAEPGVITLAMLPDGRLASGSRRGFSGTIQLWDVNTGRLSATLKGHGSWVLSLAILPDGRLASGSGAGNIKLWDVKTGRLSATVSGHGSWVLALAILPDGRLASGSGDRTIKLWDVKNGTLSATLEGHSREVHALAVLPDGRLASGSGDRTIKLWDVKNGTLSATLEGHSREVYALAVLPDGRLASGSRDGTIKQWNVKTGKLNATLEGHHHGVGVLAVLPDGRLASGSRDRNGRPASGSGDCTIKLWDVKNGKLSAMLEGHGAGVAAFAMLPDGRLASGSGGDTIKLWDVETSALRVALGGHGSEVAALAVLPDGSLASGSWDGTIKQWDVKTGKLSATLEGHGRDVTALVSLPDGRLVSGSWDKTITLWDLKTSKPSATLEGHDRGVTALAVLLDGRLASESNDHTIKLWDVKTGKLSATLEGHVDEVTALAVLPDGRLASGSADGSIKLWDVKIGTLSFALAGHGGWVAGLAVLPDGRLTSGSWDRSIKLWNIKTGKLSFALEHLGGAVSAFGILPDGRLAVGSSDWTLGVWDLSCSPPRVEVSFTADGPITSVAATSDAIFAGDANGRVHLLKLEE